MHLLTLQNTLIIFLRYFLMEQTRLQTEERKGQATHGNLTWRNGMAGLFARVWDYAASRVYNGHLQNKWMKNFFGNMQKVANFSALSPVFSECIIYNFFYRNSKISRNSSYGFLWNVPQQKTFIQRIGSVKHFKKKCQTELKFDLELQLLWRHCHVAFIPIAQKIIPK